MSFCLILAKFRIYWQMPIKYSLNFNFMTICSAIFECYSSMQTDGRTCGSEFTRRSVGSLTRIKTTWGTTLHYTDGHNFIRTRIFHLQRTTKCHSTCTTPFKLADLRELFPWRGNIILPQETLYPSFSQVLRQLRFPVSCDVNEVKFLTYI